MKTVHASYSASLSFDCVQLAEIYILTLQSGVVYRWTTHDKNIMWDEGASTSYVPAPISRGPIRYGINLETDTVDIWMGVMNDDLYNQLQNNILEGAVVQIKRVFWSDTDYASNKETLLFKGVADVEFDRVQLICHCTPQTQNLNIQVPQVLWQEACNWQLYSTACGLTMSSYAFSGSATDGDRLTLTDSGRGNVKKASFVSGDSGNPLAIGETVTGSVGGGTAKVANIVYDDSSTGRIWWATEGGAAFVDGEVLSFGGDSVTISGAIAVDPTLYQNGELEMTSGDNVGTKRPVLSDAAGVVTCFWAFPYEIAAGDTYKLYPGCDKKGETCENVFGNKGNFFGFLYMPGTDEVLF